VGKEELIQQYRYWNRKMLLFRYLMKAYSLLIIVHE